MSHNANHEIRTCPRCRLRFEALKESMQTHDCYRCAAPTVGVGNSFEVACLDAIDRLRAMKNAPPGNDLLPRPYRVLAHDVYLVESEYIEGRRQSTHLFHFVELERFRFDT